ncbi:hypothetical protein AB1Y20_007401 [Prymnesium parvum]|uniref:Uncharacterized protein n=1 Tax=Prymnesium parvum TaxID=97485 RepID=A0AB34IUQ6_PRYPA
MSNPRSHPPPRTCDNATNPFVRFVCDAGDDVFAGLLRLRRHTFCVKLLCRELRDRFPARTYTSPLAYCGSDAIEDWAEAHGCVFYDSVLYSAAISDATLVERLWGRGCVVTADVMCDAVDARATDTLRFLAAARGARYAGRMHPRSA